MDMRREPRRGIGAGPHTTLPAQLVLAAAVGAVALSSLVAGPIGRGPADSSHTGSVAPAFRLLSDSTQAVQDTKTELRVPVEQRGTVIYFDAATGADISCVLLFNNDKPNWSSWTKAWWETPPSPDSNWLQWKAAVSGRQIVVSQSMVPDSAPSDWRVLGAEGAYDIYTTELAENLVAAGMGDSIIRLGWEANDTPSDPGNSL